MPLPKRLKPTKVSPQKIKEMTELLKNMLSMIDQGANEEDVTLKKMIDTWNQQAIKPGEFSDFRDFSSWTSAKEFTQMAFSQNKYCDDLTWRELIEVIDFICMAEGKESEQSYALALLEANFNANPSDLIYWPNEWFEDEEMFHVDLTTEEIAGYLMAKSGRQLPGAPDIELKYPIPKDVG
ncbi:conserved hypothetical protein [Enterobacterales bacterium 8AC]|nr:conserved hypothetical protein [Enterobacterales bacterium 8AC]